MILKRLDHRLTANSFALLLFLVSCFTAIAQDQTTSLRWERDIKAFETADAANPPPRDAVLFVGSSSIRLWKTLTKDFPNHQVINRGYGGSEIENSTYFAARIVIPYQPSHILLYAGDNDIANGKSPRQVLADFKAFVSKVHAALPETRITFLSIKPSQARRQLLDRMREANELVRDFAATRDKIDFIDLFTPMLDEQGEPRGELFVEDRLHLNRQGYELWTRLVTPHLSANTGAR
jgi:lysophospholipase L1-like esterase